MTTPFSRSYSAFGLTARNISLTTALLLFACAPLKTMAMEPVLVIVNVFTFATPPGALTAGGFLTITNNSDEDETLMGGTANFSEVTEIHEMKMVDNVMKMRQLEQGLKIPAGETVSLKPGGYHVMFMQLTQPLKVGETQTGSLTFANAGTVQVEYQVLDRSEHMAGEGHNMKHKKKDTEHKHDHN